ncbi:MAG: energy transducer TonB [Balneolales bacterium]
MIIPEIKDEERFGLGVTFGAHLVVFLFALFIYTQPPSQERTAFIDITLGEFSDGTQAEFSREENTEVATSPEPSEVETEEPTPEQTEVAEEAQPEAEELTKDVELSEQEEEIVDEEVVTTPDTEEIEPEVVAEEVEEQEEEEAVEEPKIEDEIETEGERESGTIRGIRGRANAEQGSSQDTERASPFDLQWEGNINRSPVAQPLPTYTVDVEAEITVRFQVEPDGTVGRLQPIKRMNPELEREVFNTLRRWRFSRLPSGVPQESQWGTVTFRFVLD